MTRKGGKRTYVAIITPLYDLNISTYTHTIDPKIALTSRPAMPKTGQAEPTQAKLSDNTRRSAIQPPGDGLSWFSVAADWLAVLQAFQHALPRV